MSQCNDNRNDGADRHSEPRPDAPGFPDKYGLDYVAATARSPVSLFVYWDLSGPGSARYRGDAPGEVDWCLSLVDLDEHGGVRQRTHVPVDPDSGNYYLKVRPGGRYRVELGVRFGATFHPVCYSGERTTPRDTPPPVHSPHRSGNAVSHRTRRATDAGVGPGSLSGLFWTEDLLNTSSS